MKKLFVFIGILFFALSCSKLDSGLQKDVNAGLVKEVLAISENKSAVIAFQMLTPDEKVLFWQQRLSNIIKTHRFSQEQITHINELIEFAKPELYSENKPQKVKDQIKEFHFYWANKGKDLFTLKQLYYIGFQISQDEITFTDENPPPISDCNCCTSCWSACVFGLSGNCSTFWECKRKDSGCGIIGTSECDGKCSQVDPEGSQG